MFVITDSQSIKTSSVPLLGVYDEVRLSQGSVRIEQGAETDGTSGWMSESHIFCYIAI